MISAEIQDARIKKIRDIFKGLHKPRGLSFFATDAIILELKTSDAKAVKETFYCCIAADGTLNTKEISREGQRRQARFAQFLSTYVSKNPRYNIRERINEWKGKKVFLVKKGEDYLLL